MHQISNGTESFKSEICRVLQMLDAHCPFCCKSQQLKTNYKILSDTRTFVVLSNFENFDNNKNLQLRFCFRTWFLVADWYNENDTYLLLIFSFYNKLIWILRVFRDYVPELSWFDSFDVDNVNFVLLISREWIKGWKNWFWNND